MSSSFAISNIPGQAPDMYLDETGNWAIVRDSDYVRQSLQTRLNFYFGEWFLNTSLGIDYFGQILVKPADIVTTEALIKNTILTTNDVTSLVTYSDNYSHVPRSYSVSFSVTTVYSPENTSDLISQTFKIGAPK